MIRTVVTRGFGNGTFAGSVPLVVTRGYSIGEPATPVDAPRFEFTLPICRRLELVLPALRRGEFPVAVCRRKEF
jgi:hypothetical protein